MRRSAPVPVLLAVLVLVTIVVAAACGNPDGVISPPSEWPAGSPTVPPDHGIDAEVLERVRRSTVPISGTACGVIQRGSGYVVDRDLVVTNAHVVAGVGAISVGVDGGERAANVVAFDPDRDLAILSIEALGVAPLPSGSAQPALIGAIVGYDDDGRPEIRPYAITREVLATGTDIYGEGVVERRALLVATDVRPGNSGAPLVDAAGAVVGLVFAVSDEHAHAAYALAISEVEEVLATSDRGSAVATGSCL